MRLELMPGALVPAAALLIITITRFGWQHGVAAAMLFVLSLLAHEAGHLLAARLTGTRFSAIGFCRFGAYNRRQRADGPAELFISAAGPAVNLAIAFLIFAVTSRAEWLAQMNMWLAIFNLVPCGNSDGQRMLRLVLERRDSERRLLGL
jgi:Zn-dependent protease